jgi:predicted DNA binding CopG/RHH family protein
MMKRISLHLTEKQLAALKRLKAETGLKVADLIRRAIDYYLEKKGGKDA